ncbi:NUDIX domain-containing protein [Roseospira navarrensis]|uniref:GDP-mannose pyrophosphatase n=2 Tax=Roseospira navarrensis TaxID=140058 RepID=A0A7X1ZFJ4_9PROT|nr:NUDIX domain-containing protein [Roseospira navarrensis]
MRTADYVAILALTPDGRVPLVRQYRPAVQAWSLELPAGLLEPGETPEDCARRELEEESGFSADRIVPLGAMYADTGRLSARLHGFWSDSLRPVPDWQPEEGVLADPLDLDDFMQLVGRGELALASHVALVGLALTRGLLPRR